MRTPDLRSLIDPKVTVLIGQNGATLIDENAEGHITVQLQLDGESFNPIS